MTTTVRPARLRFTLAPLVALFAAGAWGQAGPALAGGYRGAPLERTAVPATAPTGLTQAGQPGAAPPAAAIVASGRRARVELRDGMITVAAENSSLNQILREISRQTGLQISGGVAEERVYGNYGPLSLPAMLTLLLDGTGSNLMLSGDEPGRPKLLTLTPRSGAASPPSPQQSATAEDDDTDAGRDAPPQLTPRTSQAAGAPAQTETPAQPRPFVPPVTSADAAQTAAPTTTEQSPNGVKTPQQIYDQLMKLQQQQKKAPQ